MDFALSEDQVLLESTVRGFLAESVPIDRVRQLRHAECPNDRGIWAALAELGVTGVGIAEEHGGAGLSLLDSALISQAMGHAMTPSPFLGSGVMAAAVLSASGDARATQSLARIASGEAVVGVAVTELFSVREGAGVEVRGGKLHGKAMMALDAFHADEILVALGRDSIALVKGDSPGLEATRLLTVDATRCTSELAFDGVGVVLLVEGAGAAIDRMLQAGRIALAADLLGCCEAMVEQSVAYAKERKQFDRVIGSFQAVKHMCAEMIAEVEPARSLLWYAAHSFDANPTETPLLAAHALAHISEIGRQIASVATQVHGGIGWTDEQNLHFWFKRIGNGRHLLGGPEFLRDQAARLQGFAPAA